MNDWGRIVDAMGDGLVAVDVGGQFVDVNASFLDLTGYERDRVVGADLALVHDEPDVGRIERAVASLCGSGDGSETVDATIRTASGERRPVELKLSPLSDDDGTVQRVVAVVRPAPDREDGDGAPVTYERELEWFERILEVMGDGVYALGPDGRYQLVNEYLLELLAVDRETIVGAAPSLFHTESQIELFDAAIESLLRDGGGVETVETSAERADGRTVPVEVNLTLLRGDDGEFRGTVGVVRDVTERKRRERELERYERLIEATGDAVYALDLEGRFTFSNAAHQAIVDREEEEVLGEHASIALPDEAVEGGRALIQELLASDRRCGTYEMDVLRPDGERVPTENHIALLTDEDGEFRGTVGVLRNIADRQRRERELRRQNERLEQFASIVTHDLRNPLNVAQGYLEAIEDPMADEVDRSLQRMETIIEEVLELARQGRTIDDPEPVAIADAIHEAWANVDTGDLTLAIDAGGTLLADRNRLLTLFENLFRNAVEHGSASHRSRTDDADASGGASVVTVGSDVGTDLYVADDGPGIPENEREAVFDMGHTTGADGTGFGLAIVAEIAAAHGWDVAVSESDDGGARFELRGVERVADRH